jgi:hypothetical protein
MKKFFAILFFGCVFNFVNAQNKAAEIQRRTHASDLVVEGKIVECQSFWNSDQTQIFTSNLVQLSKVFKGNVVGEKIEIITKGGMVDDRFSIVSHEAKLKSGMEGIFFCKVAKKSPSLEKTGKTAYHLSSSELGFIQFYSEQFNPPAADKTTKYKNVEAEIYNNIILSARQPVRQITPNTFEKKHGLADFPPQVLNPSIAIFFTFENVSFSSNYQKIVFDVFAHVSQNSVKFGKAKILINYSSDVFGESVASTGNVQVTKGAIIESTDYILSTTDEDAEELLIDVTSPGISQSEAYTLTTVPELFCHVELKIENLGALANISFNDFQMKGNCWYVDERSGQYQLFDRVEVESPIKEGENPNEFVLIDYTFDNFCVTQTSSDKFLEFDVNALSNVNWTRLALAHPFIGYNPDGFGTNPVANGRFTHTLSSQLATLGYSSSQSDLSNHIDLSISQSSSDSLKYIVLTTSPTKLAHCKFKILECDVQANLHFGIDWMQTFPSYYFGQLPIPFIEYGLGEEALASFYDQFLCIENAPIITKIHPKNLRAGVFEILTVEGKNLKMSATENGRFYFRSAKSPTDTIYSYAFDSDVITWTDTLIEIYVPSNLEEDGESAASGRIVVQNALGKKAKSDDSITIQYSITNVRVGDEPFRISFVNADGDGGYTFKMDDELIALNPDDCIKRALNEWACQTKINWKLSSSGIFGLDENVNDGNSTIILGDSLVIDSTTALAYAVLSGLKECDSGMSIAGWHVDDLDIVVNKYNNNQFNCDTTGSNTDEDFYITLVHELGHTHMLEHSVRGFNALYHFSANRTPSGDDIAGGLDAIDWSSGWTEGGDCPKKHEPKVCTSPVFEVVGGDFADLDIYPNPFHTGFFIRRNDENGGVLQVTLSDITGKIVFNESIQESERNKEVNLVSQPSGIYVLNIRGENQSISFKLIKLN